MRARQVVTVGTPGTIVTPRSCTCVKNVTRGHYLVYHGRIYDYPRKITTPHRTSFNRDPVGHLRRRPSRTRTEPCAGITYPHARPSCLRHDASIARAIHPAYDTRERYTRDIPHALYTPRGDVSIHIPIYARDKYIIYARVTDARYSARYRVRDYMRVIRACDSIGSVYTKRLYRTYA